MSRRVQSRGFTLVELLVAMAIVAVIGVMAFTGLTTLIRQRDLAEERTKRWQEVQLAVRTIVQDLSQIQPRLTRDEQGETYQPSLLANPNAQFALEFSRGGWANPGGFNRGTVLRVAYNVEEHQDAKDAKQGMRVARNVRNALYRLHWPVMDRTLSTVPVKTEILDRVESMEVRFLDSSGEWQTEWPPLRMSGPQRNVIRPRAVEVVIELEDFGRISRIVETSS
ncbi:MAG TPA: type II secretion system minor pseudopilin GspJ [Gammaproteobacteria bacterium]|nr:type II secretion system minor pseudopilin GspJ [Gammaproteobacteria bacterium]